MIFLCPKCGCVLRGIMKKDDDDYIYTCTNEKCASDWEVTTDYGDIIIAPYYFG